MRDDTAEIERGLLQNFEALVKRLYPGAEWQGGRVYPAAKSKADLGSFEIFVSGKKRGRWFRNSAGAGGGPIQLISYALTGDTKNYREAFSEARQFLGLERDRLTPEERARRQRRADQEKARSEAAERAARQRKLNTAGGIWSDAVSIEGTLAEAYLKGRRIVLPKGVGWPDCLRFHGDVYHDLAKVRLPALICRVDKVDGNPSAIWRIFLDPDTAGKAKVAKPKLGLGDARGGAIRLYGVAPEIGGCEGVETGFGILCLNHFRFPVWPCMSTSGLIGVELPPEVKRIRIYGDGDRWKEDDDGNLRRPPGRVAAEKAYQAHLESGVVPVRMPEPPPGKDWLDVWGEISARAEKD